MRFREHLSLPISTILLVTIVGVAPAEAQDLDAGDNAVEAEIPWPLELTADGYTVVLYQPQPERFEGNKLEGRLAVEVTTRTNSDPVYGTVWFESRVDTDREERTATIRNVEVPRSHFPEATAEEAAALSRVVGDFLQGQTMDITLDQLLTSIELSDRPDISVEDVNNDPPEIMYRDRAAVLVIIDGDPILERIEGTNLMGVVNTAFAILLDLDSNQHYLYAGTDFWYRSSSVTGPWEFTSSVPSSVSGMIPPPDEEEAAMMETAEIPDEPGPPPEIVVATVPSELIATLGSAQFTPIPGTELMFVGNTETDLMFHTPTQQYYVLLSGRWFRSEALEGPWDYVAADTLPETFLDIPADSEMGSIRTQIGGTDEANEAILDAHIPQTAAIDRNDTSLEVRYDGDPEFEPIEETTMSWAINTEVPVIETDRRYYAVSDGVWYMSDSPHGTWRVATVVPEEIYDIPASNPLHYVTYVYVYDSTPEVVYVGYTPGYTNTVVHHTTVVYHTGWWYGPWWGTMYVPRTSAWGWHVRWNPWTGWGVGFTWSNGWMTFGIGRSLWRPWCCGGFWGPVGFHRGFYAGRRAGFHAGFRAGYAAGRRNSLYRNPRNTGRNASRDAINRAQPTRPANRPTARPADRPNNIAADRNGNVHRRDNQGWEQRNNRSWERSPDQGGARTQDRAGQTPNRGGQTPQAGQRPSAGVGQQQRQQPQNRAQPQTRNRQQELNRTQQSRNRGSTRTQQFNQSRSRSGGAARGGARRR